MIVQITLLTLGTYLTHRSALRVRKKAEARLENPYEPLPDIVHDLIRPIPTVVPDIVLGLILLKTIIFQPPLFELEQNMMCLAIGGILRSFTVGLTIMPACMEPIETGLYSNIFLSSHDLMFSGHTLLFVFFGKILQNYFIQFVGPFLLIISRQHYTIDVGVSYLVYNYLNLII